MYPQVYRDRDCIKSAAKIVFFSIRQTVLLLILQLFRWYSAQNIILF